MSEQRLYRILRIAFIMIILGLLVASGFLFASGERLRRWYSTGWGALAEGDYQAAIAAYEPYLHARPFDDDAWGDLAEAYFHVGRYDDCIAAIRLYRPGGAFWIEPREREEIRQTLIRYVECVKSGEPYDREPPRFFTWRAPTEQDSPEEAPDAAAD